MDYTLLQKMYVTVCKPKDGTTEETKVADIRNALLDCCWT